MYRDDEGLHCTIAPMTLKLPTPLSIKGHHNSKAVGYKCCLLFDMPLLNFQNSIFYEGRHRTMNISVPSLVLVRIWISTMLILMHSFKVNMFYFQAVLTFVLYNHSSQTLFIQMFAKLNN